jgi:hypothetical protein
MAEHSKCHPGKPSPHGDGQRMMCSGDAAFHKAKSAKNLKTLLVTVLLLIGK